MKTRSFLPILRLFLLCLPCLALAESKAQKRFTLPPIEAFIAKWSTSGGSELGSSQTFLLELCDLLDVPRPEAPRPNLQDTSYLLN